MRLRHFLQQQHHRSEWFSFCSWKANTQERLGTTQQICCAPGQQYGYTRRSAAPLRVWTLFDFGAQSRCCTISNLGSIKRRFGKFSTIWCKLSPPKWRWFPFHEINYLKGAHIREEICPKMLPKDYWIWTPGWFSSFSTELVGKDQPPKSRYPSASHVFLRQKAAPAASVPHPITPKRTNPHFQ